MILEILVETRVGRPRPTITGVRDGVDFDADLWITDECGDRYHWRGALTYAPAPDPRQGGELVPYGGDVDHWMSGSLVAALRAPWIAAHADLVDAVVAQLGTGEGAATVSVQVAP